MQRKQTDFDKTSKLMSAKNQIVNYVFIAAILVATLLFLFKNINDFTGTGKIDLKSIDFGAIRYYWFIPAIACVALSIGFETLNLSVLSGKIGHKRSFKQSFVFASSDIYFSAITPSATGGQPAAAYYMTKSGIPLSLSSAVLVLNVTIYTVGLLVISAIALIIKPTFFLEFSALEKACVLIGVGFHAILIVICLFCMFSKKVIYFLGDIIYTILAKLHICKNKEEKVKAFREAVGGYQAALGIVRKNKWLIPFLLTNGILQRVILAPITYFVFLALANVGIPTVSFVDVFIMQLYCIVGASALPLPGGAGIAETLYITMFGNNISSSLCMLSMLFSRGISSYICVILCGMITVIHHIRLKKQHQIHEVES